MLICNISAFSTILKTVWWSVEVCRVKDQKLEPLIAGQQPEQRRSAPPVTSSKLIWGLCVWMGECSQAFPGQPRDIISPVSPGFTPRPPPSRTCLKYFTREGFILARSPNQLSGLLSRWRSSGSAPSSSWITELLAQFLRKRPQRLGQKQITFKLFEAGRPLQLYRSLKEVSFDSMGFFKIKALSQPGSKRCLLLKASTVL